MYKYRRGVSSNIGDGINGASSTVGQDVVALSPVTVTPQSGGRFYIDRNAIMTGFVTSGLSSLLVQQWAAEFANHTIDNIFGDLNYQSKMDNLIAEQLKEQALRYHFHSLWYATVQENLLMGMLAPLGFFGAEAGSAGFLADVAFNPNPIPTTRVGRWMSKSELSAMKQSGKVVESNLNGVTSVTKPPDAGAWLRQTEGSRFVEFDVPSSAIRASDGITGKIYGLNSIFGPKQVITHMPHWI